MGKKAWILGLGTLAIVAAGCGTTVKTASGAGSGSGDSGLSASGRTQVGGSSGATGGGGSAAVALPGTPGSSSGGGGSASSAGSFRAGSSALASGTSTGSGAESNGTTSALIPASAPGVTAKNVYFGFAYSSQAAAGDKAIGAAGAAPSYDTRNVVNAVIDYANSHGGFGGRKLQALYYDYNLTTDTNTQDQSACAYYTQDNKSFAILGGDELLAACGQSAGALVIGAGNATGATFQKYPNLIDPDGIALDRLGAVTATGLYNAGYFTGKLGLVTWDDPNYRATITNGYMPILSQHHITPAQTVYIAVPQQIGALGDMSAAVSSAVTKFKALGIDHVIIQDGPAGVWSGAGLTLEWMDQAKSQNYFPRYGQNANNAPGWSVLPSDQMNKALAIDDSDYDPSDDQGWHTNQARNQCFAIEAQAGYPVNTSNANDEGIAATACDYVFFLQRVINSLPEITTAGFIQAAERLGTSFSNALIFGSKFEPGRRDGADEVRTEEYFSSCSCLKYQSTPYYAG